MTASHHNPDLKALYDRLTVAETHHKVAIVTVMRKLIIHANALLRQGRRWSPEASDIAS